MAIFMITYDYLKESEHSQKFHYPGHDPRGNHFSNLTWRVSRVDRKWCLGDGDWRMRD